MAVALSGPGIFWVNSGVTTPDVLSYDAFVRWYEEIHIPDWMGAKPGAMPVGWRYQAEDAGRATPFLVVYKFANLSDLGSPELKTVPISDPSLPEGGPINKFTRFQAITGPHLETWKRADAPKAPLLVSEAIDPAENTTEQFHDWYRHVYVKEVSQLKGWRRTSRFENAMSRDIKAGDEVPANRTPRWLALHEFEAGSFANGTKISSLLGQSSQTKQVASSAINLDTALFKLVRVYGDKLTQWEAPDKDQIL